MRWMPTQFRTLKRLRHHGIFAIYALISALICGCAGSETIHWAQNSPTLAPNKTPEQVQAISYDLPPADTVQLATETEITTSAKDL